MANVNRMSLGQAIRSQLVGGLRGDIVIISLLRLNGLQRSRPNGIDRSGSEELRLIVGRSCVATTRVVSGRLILISGDGVRGQRRSIERGRARVVAQLSGIKVLEATENGTKGDLTK